MLILTLLISAGLLILWWYKHMRAKEVASKAARTWCQQHQAQLLDGSAYLQQIKLLWANKRPYWARRYSFEFTDSSDQRKQRQLFIFANKVTLIDEPDAIPQTQSNKKSKVVQFKPRSSDD